MGLLTLYRSRIESIRANEQSLDLVARIALGRLREPERARRRRAETRYPRERKAFYAAGRLADGLPLGILVTGNAENEFLAHAPAAALLAESYAQLDIRVPGLLGLVRAGRTVAMLAEDFGAIRDIDAAHPQVEQAFEYFSSPYSATPDGALIARDFYTAMPRRHLAERYESLLEELQREKGRYTVDVTRRGVQ